MFAEERGRIGHGQDRDGSFRFVGIGEFSHEGQGASDRGGIQSHLAEWVEDDPEESNHYQISVIRQEALPPIVSASCPQFACHLKRPIARISKTLRTSECCRNRLVVTTVSLNEKFEEGLLRQSTCFRNPVESVNDSARSGVIGCRLTGTSNRPKGPVGHDWLGNHVLNRATTVSALPRRAPRTAFRLSAHRSRSDHWQ